MLSHRRYILCFGRDRMLLARRQRLLERSGYLSLATSDPVAASRWLATESITILVLCHTLRGKDMDAITRVHYNLRSSAAILRLPTDQWNFSVGQSGLLCEAQTTPSAFLAAISEASVRLRHSA